MELINVNVLPETNVDWYANGELANATVLNRPAKAVATHLNTLITEVAKLNPPLAPYIGVYGYSAYGFSAYNF